MEVLGGILGEFKKQSGYGLMKQQQASFLNTEAEKMPEEELSVLWYDIFASWST